MSTRLMRSPKVPWWPGASAPAACSGGVAGILAVGLRVIAVSAIALLKGKYVLGIACLQRWQDRIGGAPNKPSPREPPA